MGPSTRWTAYSAISKEEAHRETFQEGSWTFCLQWPKDMGILGLGSTLVKANCRPHYAERLPSLGRLVTDIQERILGCQADRERVCASPRQFVGSCCHWRDAVSRSFTWIEVVVPSNTTGRCSFPQQLPAQPTGGSLGAWGWRSRLSGLSSAHALFWG